MRPSLSERECQLSGELGWHRRLVPAVAGGKPLFRHSESTEHQVPHWKRAGEIGVTPFFERGVMPSMENWTGQHISERA
jgi:hypothetical protein